MIRYMSGGYTLALEYFRTETRTAIFAGTPTPAFGGFRDLVGNQVIMTGMYSF
jgi:hypothetical protein